MNAPDDPTVRTSPSSARRKLIRASFAVPAIATVASGSALAGTSTSCFARQLNPHAAGYYPGVSDWNSSTTDTFMRVQLAKRVHQNMVTYYVDGNTLDTLMTGHDPRLPRLAKSMNYALNKNTYRLFNIATNMESGSILTSKPTGHYNPAGGKFAVLRFGSDGKIIGVGRSSNLNQSAVQLSCWSSLRPTGM
jgi:hypothetical protein